MKAVRVHTHGGREVLQLDEVPVPQPGPGQVLVKLEAIGVNFVEIYQRLGWYKMSLPYTVGGEGAGVVVAVGPGVSGVKEGDRVVSTNLGGSYAEYAILAADRAVPIPDRLDSKTAAAAMLQGMTAHYLLHSTYPIKSGETCLVHAAAGGVGLLLTQIAKRLGARVIGTVSTPEKAQQARRAGADDVILYTEQDFEAETKRLTGGRGVQVVYDSVGKDTFDRSLNCLAIRGYVVLFGQSSGQVSPVDPQVLNAKGSLFLTRPTLAHYVLTRNDLLWRAGDILGWVAAGELDVHIGAEVPLTRAADAHALLESRKTTGKVILLP